MRNSAQSIIIGGNFAPARSGRALRMSARLFGLLFVILIMGALAIYGIKVHFEDSINQVARNTRELNEQNKELLVKLNHIRSYKNVEAAATHVPHLHMAETVIEVPTRPNNHLPSMPPVQQEFPRVYGY